METANIIPGLIVLAACAAFMACVVSYPLVRAIKDSLRNNNDSNRLPWE